MIKLPKLDERSYSEIREEAIKNIVRHSPEWTNHNSSDPGVTLIELFSSMTEMLSYQLNRVPKKNYLAFLDMLGIQGRLAQSAKALVQFKLSPARKKDSDKRKVFSLKKNTQLSTHEKNTTEPIIFETIKDLSLVDMEIKAVYSKFKQNNESVQNDHSKNFVQKRPFIPFSTKDIPIYYPIIYLSLDNFKFFKEKNIITIAFLFATRVKDCNNDGISEFFKNSILWEYYDGAKWNELTINKNISEKENKLSDDIGEENYNILPISFYGNISNIEPYKDSEIDNEYTIRAVFKSIPKWMNCIKLYNISMFNHTSRGVQPDSCFLDNSLEIENFDKSFYPFGEKPKTENFFYIENHLALSDKDKTFDIDFILDDSVKVVPNGVVIKWEYWNGESWKILLLIDKNESKNPKNYKFEKNLSVEIKTPNDIEKKDIFGEQKYVIKITLEKGNYGEENDFLDEVNRQNQASHRDDLYDIKKEEIYPPFIKDIIFHYTSKEEKLNKLVINDGNFNKKLILKENDIENIHLLFENDKITKDSLYIMFNGFISDERLDVFFEIDGDNEINNGIARNFNESEILYSWEIYTGSEWIRLRNIDATENLTQSGMISFFPVGVSTAIKQTISNKNLEGMLIRAKLEYTRVNEVPPIKGIYLNSIIVEQKESLSQYLGVSTGLGKQEFSFNEEMLNSSPIIKVDDEEYKHVKRFIEYSRYDSIYRFDYLNNIIQFGDNKYGKIPDSRKNITISYQVTKGSKGNVSKGEIETLRQGNPFIDSVTNITNATGGSNQDSLDDLIRYAPNTLLSRERAVTLEDYKALTIGFSSSIITAKVFNDSNNNIVILVVTKDILKKDGFINKKLLEELENSLKRKSLVTVFPIVKEPNRIYFNVDIKVKSTLYDNVRIQRERDIFTQELNVKLRDESKRYFDLKTGGFYGKGFPVDKEISLIDFNYILNQINNTYYITYIEFTVNNKKVDGNLLVKSDELLLFNDIVIEIVE